VPNPAISSPAQSPHPEGHVLYPNQYVWLVLFSALDIMLTHRILGAARFAGVADAVFGEAGPFNGRELNSLADWVIKQFGLWGAIGLKFASVILVILICEYVGTKSPKGGRRLAWTLVILSTFPVAWELVLLAWFAFKGDAPSG
jgi:hypothetical protein